MALLFGRLYELRAEEAAEGGAKVVVVGPTCAGKTTFIKQFLEPCNTKAAGGGGQRILSVWCRSLGAMGKAQCAGGAISAGPK